ncbi:hypothetical protein [Microvirga makkahensis]|uniref:Uncharacterized protein n=1 Tax=Microvirga makkahensis TaxID=1128670 RepID=A0A7X3MRU3_9HYPH|nr:hypothetical protein [Microvirga makkahensis]MXQ12072.1 hypothetical protein [Microvirga makkahensis]
MRSLAFAIGLLGWSAAAPISAQEAPAAAELLFETHDWQALRGNAALLYRYERVSDPSFEQVRSFSDTIRLVVRPGSAVDSRNVQVEMFSSPHRRPAGPFDEVTGNPILILFLEQHLQTLVAAVGANPRYLRNAVRAGLREKASVIATTATYQGQPVSAWRVEMQPFAQDPHRTRMKGLDALKYSFVTSERVPGEIHSIEIKAVTTDGRILLQETLSYDPNGS